MDIATIIGIILGMGAIIGSILLMTPDFGMFGSCLLYTSPSPRDS